MRVFIHFAVCALALLALSACAAKAPEEKIGDVTTLYNQGMDALEAGNNLEAVNYFEELERQHPYSGWATKASLMKAYAHFENGSFAEAVSEAERFIRLHPGHEDLVYAYYLKGLAYYHRISDIKREQAMTKQALEAFEALVRRFPDSSYAKDARLKITLCQDHLAGKEMMIGRFYQDQQRYLASANRFREVLETYETSSHTPEALYRLTEVYLALGVPEEAQAAAAVLGHNFPASDWYKKAYTLLGDKDLTPRAPEEGQSWLARFMDGVGDLF